MMRLLSDLADSFAEAILAVIGLAIMFGIMAFCSPARAAGLCGDTDWKVAKPDATASSFWATNSDGTQALVTVNVWWTPSGGTPINIASYPEAQIRTVTQGGTALDLTALNCSGAAGTLNAKAVAAAPNGKESTVASAAYTFRRPSTTPAPPVLIP